MSNLPLRSAMSLEMPAHRQHEMRRRRCSSRYRHLRPRYSKPQVISLDSTLLKIDSLPFECFIPRRSYRRSEWEPPQSLPLGMIATQAPARRLAIHISDSTKTPSPAANTALQVEIALLQASLLVFSRGGQRISLICADPEHRMLRCDGQEMTSPLLRGIPDATEQKDEERSPR